MVEKYPKQNYEIIIGNNSETPPTYAKIVFKKREKRQQLGRKQQQIDKKKRALV